MPLEAATEKLAAAVANRNPKPAPPVNTTSCVVARPITPTSVAVTALGTS